MGQMAYGRLKFPRIEVLLQSLIFNAEAKMLKEIM